MNLFFSFCFYRDECLDDVIFQCKIPSLDKENKKPSPHADNEDWEQNLIPLGAIHRVLKDKTLTILPSWLLGKIREWYEHSLN